MLFPGAELWESPSNVISSNENAAQTNPGCYRDRAFCLLSTGSREIEKGWNDPNTIDDTTRTCWEQWCQPHGVQEHIRSVTWEGLQPPDNPQLSKHGNRVWRHSWCHPPPSASPWGWCQLTTPSKAASRSGQPWTFGQKTRDSDFSTLNAAHFPHRIYKINNDGNVHLHSVYVTHFPGHFTPEREKVLAV